MGKLKDKYLDITSEILQDYTRYGIVGEENRSKLEQYGEGVGFPSRRVDDLMVMCYGYELVHPELVRPELTKEENDLKIGKEFLQFLEDNQITKLNGDKKREAIKNISNFMNDMSERLLNIPINTELPHDENSEEFHAYIKRTGELANIGMHLTKEDFLLDSDLNYVEARNTEHLQRELVPQGAVRALDLTNRYFCSDDTLAERCTAKYLYDNYFTKMNGKTLKEIASEIGNIDMNCLCQDLDRTLDGKPYDMEENMQAYLDGNGPFPLTEEEIDTAKQNAAASIENMSQRCERLQDQVERMHKIQMYDQDSGLDYPYLLNQMTREKDGYTRFAELFFTMSRMNRSGYIMTDEDKQCIQTIADGVKTDQDMKQMLEPILDSYMEIAIKNDQFERTKKYGAIAGGSQFPLLTEGVSEQAEMIREGKKFLNEYFPKNKLISKALNCEFRGGYFLNQNAVNMHLDMTEKELKKEYMEQKPVLEKFYGKDWKDEFEERYNWTHELAIYTSLAEKQDFYKQNEQDLADLSGLEKNHSETLEKLKNITEEWKPECEKTGNNSLIKSLQNLTEQIDHVDLQGQKELLQDAKTNCTEVDGNEKNLFSKQAITCIDNLLKETELKRQIQTCETVDRDLAYQRFYNASGACKIEDIVGYISGTKKSFLGIEIGNTTEFTDMTDAVNKFTHIMKKPNKSLEEKKKAYDVAAQACQNYVDKKGTKERSTDIGKERMQGVKEIMRVMNDMGQIFEPMKESEDQKVHQNSREQREAMRISFQELKKTEKTNEKSRRNTVSEHSASKKMLEKGPEK